MAASSAPAANNVGGTPVEQPDDCQTVAVQSVQRHRVVEVSNWAELDAALVAANGESTIKMRAGEYVATHTLVIPAGVTFVGEERCGATRGASRPVSRRGR